MTPERWQRIDTIFQAAIELSPGDRSAFLDSSCGDDDELRREVEAMLASDERGLSLIDAPAFEAVAGVLANDQPELAEGEKIDHYQILALLGRGGMGEVYLAEDTELGRKVAIKLLPAEFTRDDMRLRRFRQEARAASALNHPNILTIHQILEVDGRYFIATEFIDGETLRQRIKGARLNIGEAIDIATQIGSALAAAHQAGIVHRDVKPENIMLRRDGYVKILDFGLAKLTEQKETATRASAADDVNISSGLVMGTLRYMSPEQAAGLSVDTRSDIFSFGVVMYEMLAGRTPFTGEAAGEVIAAVLNEEPGPLSEFLTPAPEELQRIVGKALRKDKVERYQTAEEMLCDLRGLKDTLEIESQRLSWAQDSQAIPAGTTKAIATAPTVEYLLDRIKDHKIGASLTFAAMVLAAFAVSFGLYKYFRSGAARFEKISATKFTTFDDAIEPSISPDGKSVVYAKGPSTEGEGKFSLWVKAIGSATEVQIVPPMVGGLMSTLFSRDGKHVLYTARLPNQGFTAFLVPTLGGMSTKLQLTRPARSYSPDGKRLTYFDNRLSEGKTVVMVADSDGSNARGIFTRQAPNYYWTALRSSWSPDGKLIACVGQNGTESFPRIFAVNVETGTESPITAQKWTSMSGVVWLPDMSGLLTAASEETSSIQQIWHISYPGGEARRITHDTANYSGIDLSADGRTLVTSKVEVPTTIWVMPVEHQGGAGEKSAKPPIDTGKARQINVTNLNGTGIQANARLCWTPDGRRIVYMSEESGNADIWSMNADGSDRRQLTTDPHWDTAAVVSPDGRHIAFMSNRAGAENIWLMNVDGGNQRRLTSKLLERVPGFSADGRWIYFVAWESRIATIWKIPVEGGDPTQVITDLSFSPFLSPDGKFLMYNASGKIYITPAEGGPPLKSFEARGGEYMWSPNGQALTYLSNRNNVTNLWEQPLDGGESRQLTNYTSGRINKYALSSDGKHLAVSQSKIIGDAVLINDLR